MVAVMVVIVHAPLEDFLVVVAVVKGSEEAKLACFAVAVVLQKL